MVNPLRSAETAATRSASITTRTSSVHLAGGLPTSGQQGRAFGRVLDDAAALTPANGANAPATPSNAAARTDVDAGALALDLGQIALDIIGIFEPTPFADGTNAVISVFRGDWFGALTSAAGVIPYIGDAAKLGKLGKWAETVANAVELAASSPALASRLAPALRKIRDALDAAPEGVLKKLPDDAQDALRSMKSKLDDFFARGADDAAPRIRGRDELLPGGKVPSTRGGRFNDWFDDLSPAEFRSLWDDPAIRRAISQRIREPGGLHEWYMVKHAPDFKDWGLSMEEIKHFRSKISELRWTNPHTGLPGAHGQHGSGAFHAELSEVIENARSPADVNRGIDALLERWSIDPAVLPDIGGG